MPTPNVGPYSEPSWFWESSCEGAWLPGSSEGSRLFLRHRTGCSLHRNAGFPSPKPQATQVNLSSVPARPEGPKLCVLHKGSHTALARAPHPGACSPSTREQVTCEAPRELSAHFSLMKAPVYETVL